MAKKTNKNAKSNKQKLEAEVKEAADSKAEAEEPLEARASEGAEEVVAAQAEAPTEQESTTSAAQQVTDSVLGDMFGIGKEKEVIKELPEDTIELSVPEDRGRLLLAAVVYLLLALAGLFLVAGGLGATQISGSMGYMVITLIGLPVAWFASKAMGKRFNRYAQKTNIVDFGEKYVFIYAEANPKKALVVPYKEIKSYKLIRQGAAIRLLFKGNWVDHPSGYYLVDINKTFSSETVASLETDIVKVMREHRVNRKK